MLTSLLLLGLALLSPTVQAQWTRNFPSAQFSLSPPPDENSAVTAKDFEILKKLQMERSAEQCDYAAKQEHPDFENLFGPASGALTEAEYKKLQPLLGRVVKLAERVASYHKKKFQRPRPYKVDPEIKPCIPLIEGDRAYPSSHAAMGVAGACILSELYPRRAKSLLGHGKYLGDLRMLVGIHHPSDVHAGQRLGQQVCEALLGDKEFLAELDELR